MTTTRARRAVTNFGTPKVPWITFLFLVIVFFVSSHDLFYSMKGFSPSAEEEMTSVAEGALTIRIGYLGLGAIGAMCLIRRSRTRLRMMGALAWLALFFAVWNCSSLVWAEDPALTFRRLVAFGVICLGALGVSKRLSSQDIVSWILFATASFLAVGVLAEAALGSFHPLASGYRFAGTLHPNAQGVNCALLTLSSAAASRIAGHNRNLFRALAVIGFAFLALTKSRTAFGAALLALLFYWGLVWPRLRTLAVTYLATTALVFLLFVGPDTFLPFLRRVVLLGRESPSIATLTNRVPVWQECLDYGAKRPLQGYGYGGFWTPTHISDVSATHWWGVAEAHSAYLDLLLSVGLVGVIAYVAMLALAIIRAVARYRASQNSCYAFLGGLLLLCALDGVLESGVVERSMFAFVCMLALTHLAFRCPVTSKKPVGP